MTKKNLWPVLLVGFVLSACTSSGPIKKKKGQFDDVRKEYEKVVTVKEIEPPPAPPAAESKKSESKSQAKPESKPKGKAGAQKIAEKPKASVSKPLSGKKKMSREPKLEDSVGFDGRRPLVDPFRVGESVTLAVKYFNITAGDVVLSVRPFVEVNGEKSYRFMAKMQSNKFFSSIYTVNNLAETLVDYDSLVPHTLTLDNNESSRVVESKTFFDWKTNMGHLWEKKVSKKKGEETEELEWKLEPYSQNIISALFYLRVFQYEVGKTLSFRVADDGKNYVFKGKVLRREKLETDLGAMDTYVVQLQFQLDGALKQSGDNLIWVTADDRKFVVRVESKIKIGTLVGKLKSLDRGK